MSNCLFEATLQSIEAQCNCVPRYFAEEVGPDVSICAGKSISCMSNLKDLMGDNRSVIDGGQPKVFNNVLLGDFKKGKLKN